MDFAFFGWNWNWRWTFMPLFLVCLGVAGRRSPGLLAGLLSLAPFACLRTHPPRAPRSTGLKDRMGLRRLWLCFHSLLSRSFIEHRRFPVWLVAQIHSDISIACNLCNLLLHAVVKHKHFNFHLTSPPPPAIYRRIIIATRFFQFRTNKFTYHVGRSL